MVRAVIIVNPRAGAGASGADRLSRRLAQRLAGRGIGAHSIALAGSGAGDWQQRLAASLDAGAGQVFVLGGDGTVLAVASLLFRLGRNLDRPLGIVPLGIANLLA
jgi:diacylglycerol kinase family enzyme